MTIKPQKLKEILKRRSKKPLALLLCLFVVGFGFGQNLVPNPSFEDTVQCPIGFGEINNSQFWSSPSLGSPDYFNSCNFAINISTPVNWFGYQNAKTGTSYSGIFAYYDDGFENNYREYIQCKLTEPLVANNQYCVKFSVSLSDSSKWTTSSMGAFFSQTEILSTTSSLLNYNPQVKNNELFFLDDKEYWTEITGCFTALGGEQYLTIGNFDHDSSTPLSQSNYFGVFTGAFDSYYYIDDIEVYKDNSGSLFSNKELDKITFYPNPTKDILIVENLENLEIKTIFIEKIDGTESHTFYNFEKLKTIKIGNMSSGVYVLRITLSNNENIIRKLIVEP